MNALRAAQVGALATHALLVPTLVARALEASARGGGHAAAAFAGVGLGWLAADLASGLVHWMADRFGSPRTPVFGPFIRAFREHHGAPEALLAHDLVDTSGDHALVALLPAVPAALGAHAAFPCAFVATLVSAVLLTGPIHQWAHAPAPPRLVRALQRARLVLPPAHHRRHHEGARDASYCITCGWLDVVLDRGLLRRAEKALARRALRRPRPAPEAGGSAARPRDPDRAGG